MAITWDDSGNHLYETGIDHMVLYRPDANGDYTDGVAWNGITAFNETPSGADSNPVWADNIKYLDLRAAEEFGATLECLYTPAEFEAELLYNAMSKAGIKIEESDSNPII